MHRFALHAYKLRQSTNGGAFLHLWNLYTKNVDEFGCFSSNLHGLTRLTHQTAGIVHN